MKITTTHYSLNEKNVSIQLHPMRYGNENVTEAFSNKEMAFELEVKTINSSHREIIDLEAVKELQEQIDKALNAYYKFVEES